LKIRVFDQLPDYQVLWSNTQILASSRNLDYNVLTSTTFTMYAIIDVETTGGQARYERITEIAIVRHDGQRVLDTFSTLINPEKSIPWNITRITGISDDMVADAPKFYEVAKQIVEITEGAIFVAHNVTFDYSFVREEFARLGFLFSRRQLCTVRLARRVFPGIASYSLSNLKQHFGIHAERSHRALDDTLATVQLFEMMLAEQNGEKVRTFVNNGVRETKLPQNISLQRLHEVPDTCGVYYLHDEAGAVIYVGKSLNIRKRLFEHFADLTPKGEKLRVGVNDLSYEVTGSELVALLLESTEIKRLQPSVNRAQRTRNFSGAIFTYLNEQGYRCLLVGKRTARNLKQFELVADYPKVEQAKSHLLSLVRQHELCYRLTHLDSSEHACFHYAIKKCHGACVGTELPEEYNVRLEQALVGLRRKLVGNYFILENGRTPGEKAVIAVQEGCYMGYGFVETDLQLTTEDLLETLAPPPPDPQASRIIQGYVEGRRQIKTVPF